MNKLKAYFHLLIVYGLWGSSFALLKLLLNFGLGPFSLAFWRLLFSSLIFFLFSFLKKERIQGLRSGSYGRHFFIGLMMWGVGHIFLVRGEEQVDSGLAALIYASVPIMGVVLELISGKRHLKQRLVISLLCSFLGLFVLTFSSAQGSYFQGDFFSIGCIFLSAFGWAYGTFISQYNKGEETKSLLFHLGLQQFAGMLLSFVFVFFSHERFFPKNYPYIDQLPLFALLVLGPTVIAYLSYFKVLKKLGINVALSFAYVNPLVATAIGVIFMHEPLGFGILIGAPLILLGVFLL